MGKIKIVQQNIPEENKKAANLFMILFLARLLILLVTVVLFGAETALLSRRSKATNGSINQVLRYLEFIDTYDLIQNVCAWISIGALLVQLVVFYKLTPYEKCFESAVVLAIFTGVCSVARVFLANVHIGAAILVALFEGLTKLGYTYFYYTACSNVAGPRDGQLAHLWKSLFVQYAIVIGLNIVSVLMILAAKGAAGASLVALGVSAVATALPIIILYREVKYLLRTEKTLK